MPRLAFATLLVAGQVWSQTVNPTVKSIVEAVSESRIAETMQKLESFGTRHTFSNPDHTSRGIGAARKWIHDQFASYSPRLEVRYDSYKVRAQRRIMRDVEVVNVVAVLPGHADKDRQILVTAHYDSLNLKPVRGGDAYLSEADAPAPGASDNASGTAAVMELARVMSRCEFDKTVIFIAFAGEEQMLVGSTLHATRARERREEIEAVLNSDLIGTEVAGDGRAESHTVRVFSSEPMDSGSRSLARYFKAIGERYVPSMKVALIFREDRLGRGGDHSAFDAEGFAAVRLTSAAENFGTQHTGDDTFENASPAYAARVTRLKAAVAASLALAPAPPLTSGEEGFGSTSINRGTSRYDALLRWRSGGDADDIAGYAVVYRSTTAPDWENQVLVGNVTEFTLEGKSIDDTVFGVKAIDKDGNESLVSAWVPRPRERQTIEIY